ncbi:Rrna-processing protein ebp2, partial [Globisporangium splendens]
MGRKGGRGLSTLVRAEEAAEEEILETPALSSFAEAGAHSDGDDDEDEEDEDEEAELERRLVEEKLREEEQTKNQAENKGIYNKDALLTIASEWDKEKPLAWVETLDTCEFPLELENVHDDLKREVAFYNQTLASVRFARDRLKRENIAYKRPEDYFAEMLKSDAHMAKVKDKLIYEQKKITAVEERKKSQAHRKVAKEIQAEKLKQRAQQKKETLEAVKQWKKRKNSDKNGLGDDNDEQLESIVSENNSNKRKRADDKNDSSSKKPRVNRAREAKDKKFGFGGKKRFAKRNSKESTNDFSQFPGARKGARGGKPAAAVRAGASKGKATPKGGKRAGKDKRSNQRANTRR